MNFFERNRYKPPLLRVTVAVRPGFALNWRTFGERVTGPNGSAGRTNGMPWDGTCPVTEGTELDSHRDKAQDMAQTPKGRAKIVRENQSV